MTQIGTEPGDKPHRAPRAMPLWRQALIVVGLTGALGVMVGLLPHFQN